MTTPTNSHKAWTDKGGHVRAVKSVGVGSGPLVRNGSELVTTPPGRKGVILAGCYSRPPFTSVQAVIGPSLPQALRDQTHVLWLPIPGEARLRADAFGAHAHYPRVFEQTLTAIAERISPGDLVLVGAGILGKIYCEAVRVQGGIAVDVGSVLDLCSGYGGTRGEYSLHPWLHHAAGTAFRQA